MTIKSKEIRTFWIMRTKKTRKTRRISERGEIRKTSFIKKGMKIVIPTKKRTRRMRK